MSLLHTVNKSPFTGSTLDNCLSRMSPGSALLLLEDGVYAALAPGAHAAKLAGHAPVYALGPDLAARGLADKALVEGVQVVDYDGFVDLCTQYSAVQSWF